MPSSLKTTHRGHRISVEPFEFGYVAKIADKASGMRFTAASPSAQRALEAALKQAAGNADAPPPLAECPSSRTPNTTGCSPVHGR